jgi:hypothetical protein
MKEGPFEKKQLMYQDSHFVLLLAGNSSWITSYWQQITIPKSQVVSELLYLNVLSMNH